MTTSPPSERSAPRPTLVDTVRRLLLGPFEEAEVLRASPTDTYLTGILWPKDSLIGEMEDDAGQLEREVETKETADRGVPGYRSVRPCSIGITCAVDPAARVRITLEGTARYVARTEATAADREKSTDTKGAGAAERPGVANGPSADAASAEPAGQPEHDSVEWVRQPLDLALVIEPGELRELWRTSEFVRADGRTVVTDRDLEVHIRRRSAGGQFALTVTLINCAPEQEGRERPAACLFQACIRVEATLPDGAGGIRPRRSVMHVDDEDARSNALLYRNAHEYAIGHGVSAEWMQPVDGAVSAVCTSWLPTASVEATSSDGHSMLRAFAKRDPSPLAAAWLGTESGRSEVVTALDELVQTYRLWITTTLPDTPADIEKELLEAARQNRKRCLEAADRMARGVSVLRSSGIAWQAFALANRAMDMQAQFTAKGDRAKPLIWRPFQVAFMLLVIPSLVEPGDETRNCMDLLWFPTGGGKTEAYLALTAFQIFLERLRQPQRRSAGGVDVLMRYTLRLLTIQQFQRAAALITACELLRSADTARLGDARISLGLYVGGDSTPNRTADAIERLKEERQGQKPTSTPRQLLVCPACGTALGPYDYRWPRDESTIEICCPSKQCVTKGTSLPVTTTDEIIYAMPPSLLIGTVDKFAQLPRQERLRTLFGLDGALRPGLIIQDELHLISGPLGSMTGLYEAAIDLLCTDSRGARPKIIGSTATIGRAATQVQALFDRSVLQFPPPGFDAADSFFAVRDPKGNDRLYLGVATAGRSPKFALQAVIAALLQAVQGLQESGRFDDQALDAYWTCVAYFNSLRELGGAHVLMLDDVPRQMKFLARRLGSRPRNISEPPLELSSRVPSRDIPKFLRDLEQPLGAGDIFVQPVNAVLASNMISVGVDVPRLGLMVVNGQPKSTAEYIQASSRVGRSSPGLVVTLYNFGRPRDLSHFEHFVSYHAALYRGVEATSVTPWAPRARDKALHATFASLVRHLLPGMSGDKDALRFDGSAPAVRAIVAGLADRAARGSRGLEGAQTRRDLEEIVQAWSARVIDSQASAKPLLYWEKRAPFGKSSPHLMKAAEDARRASAAAWPTPNSMRDVEPSTAFVFRDIGARRRERDGDTPEQTA